MPMTDKKSELLYTIDFEYGAFSSMVSAELLVRGALEQVNFLNDPLGIKILIGANNLHVHKRQFSYPLRLGQLMDYMLEVASKDAVSSVLDYFDLRFLFAQYEYVGEESVCVNTESGERIKLTDKERDVLGYLYRADNHQVKRENLLECIWGYARDVETHTIETHIYRLRQKIEDNPSDPKILITSDDCYCLEQVHDYE